MTAPATPVRPKVIIPAIPIVRAKIAEEIFAMNIGLEAAIARSPSVPIELTRFSANPIESGRISQEYLKYAEPSIKPEIVAPIK
jgi:hypothetical protein